MLLFKNALRFVSGKKPLLFYQDRRTKNKDCAKMMAAAKEIAARLGELAQGESNRQELPR